MTKRVTFVEHLKKEKLLRDGGEHILMRSAECNKRSMDGSEWFPGQPVRRMPRATHLSVSAGGQHMKTIHIPKSMMSAPFLQHPALTAGQRRYLCSIANVYSTEHTRRQMKQRYLGVLQACAQSGQSSPCRRRGGERQRGENGAPAKSGERAAEARARRGQRRGRSLSDAAAARIVLPKIVHR